LLIVQVLVSSGDTLNVSYIYKQNQSQTKSHWQSAQREMKTKQSQWLENIIFIVHIYINNKNLTEHFFEWVLACQTSLKRLKEKHLFRHFLEKSLDKKIWVSQGQSVVFNQPLFCFLHHNSDDSDFYLIGYTTKTVYEDDPKNIQTISSQKLGNVKNLQMTSHTWNGERRGCEVIISSWDDNIINIFSLPLSGQQEVPCF